MSPSERLRVLLAVGPVILLLFLGFALTLRSGVVHAAPGHAMRRMALNFSQTMILVAACVVGIVILHQLLGMQLSLG